MSLESCWWIKLVNVKGLFTELINRIVLNTSTLFSFPTKQTKTKITQKYIIVMEMQLTPFVELDVKS